MTERRSWVIPAAAVAAAGILASVGCARKLTAPPTLFPVSNTWVAALGVALDGPLATDGDQIYATGRDGMVFAIDRLTGSVAWKVQQGPGPVSATESDVVHREIDGSVSCLDPESGKLRWRSQSGIAGSLPVVIDQDRILVAGEGLAALDLATGHSLWSLPGPPKVTTMPTRSGPWVFAGEEDGTLRCRDRASGGSLWTFKTAETLFAAPVVDAERRVFFGATDGGFVSLSSKGKERWRWKLGADVQQAPAVFRDRVLFAGLDAVLYALRQRDGHLVWKSSLLSRPLSGPIMVRSAVLVACFESDIIAFDAETGRPLGALRTSSGLRTAPLVIGDRLYASLRDRSVVGLRLGDPAALPPPPPVAPLFGTPPAGAAPPGTAPAGTAPVAAAPGGTAPAAVGPSPGALASPSPSPSASPSPTPVP